MSEGVEPLTHTPGPHMEWNESYYLCFSDRRNRLSGMTRLGFKPNRGEASTFLLLFLPDGSVAGFQGAEKMGHYPASLEACGMAHTRQRDGTWRYRFTGGAAVVRDPADFPKIRENPKLITRLAPVSIDLSFTPLHETYEYSEHMTPESREIGRKSGDEHWEQVAKICGEVRVGEEVYRLTDVIGQRDHTHGVRDWTGVGSWLYYVVWFDEGLAVNPAAIVLDDDRLSVGGFLWKGGRNTPIVGLRILDQQFKNGVIPVCSTLELTDANGERHILRGRAGPIVPIPFFDERQGLSILAQGFGEYELDGVKGGYGTYETLRIGKTPAP